MEELLYLIIIMIIILVALWAILYGIELALGKKGSKKNAEKAARIADARKKAKQEYETALARLVCEYGEPTQIVELGLFYEFNIAKQLIVFEESKKLVVENRAIDFSDIVSYNITDDYEIKHGEVHSIGTTKTSTGNMIKRGVVGGVLLGGVGAVVGGATAKKKEETITYQGNDKIMHKFELSINIRSLQTPLIRIKIGRSVEKAELVNAIMAYITAENGANK